MEKLQADIAVVLLKRVYERGLISEETYQSILEKLRDEQEERRFFPSQESRG